MKTLNRPSILLLIPLLSLSTVSTFAAPAQQEQLDQSRAQEAKRLPSQDISVRLLPADQPQMTDIELTVKRSKNIYGTISFDDSGLEDTSRLQ